MCVYLLTVPEVTAGPIDVERCVDLFLLPLSTLYRIFPRDAYITLIILSFIRRLMIIMRLGRAEAANGNATRLARSSIVVRILKGNAPATRSRSIDRRYISETGQESLCRILMGRAIAVNGPTLAIYTLIAYLAMVALLAPCNVYRIRPR